MKFQVAQVVGELAQKSKGGEMSEGLTLFTFLQQNSPNLKSSSPG